MEEGIGLGWWKPRLAASGHYFYCGLSLCRKWGFWDGPRWWLRWYFRKVEPGDKVCQECYRRHYEARVLRTR